MISELEIGSRAVSLKTANYLAPALNTTPHYILHGDTKIEPRNGLIDLSVTEESSTTDTPFSIEIYLKQIGGDEVNAVNARELWCKLEVKTDFSDWVKGRIAKYEFVEGIDFCRFLEKKEANNATMTEYFISLDMAKELSMVENNAQGKKARRYFIECEKKAKAKTEKIDHLSPEVIAVLKQARTVQLAMGMTKVQASKYARDLIADRFGFDMERATTGTRNEQLHLRLVK
jgi:phage anti-repressor protein